MEFVNVTTQAELDAAVENGDIPVCRSGFFTASDSASVRAYGSASVTAYGSASVTAYDSASVRAYGSASVTAYDSASVTAYGSASVTAYDSASVTASKYVGVTRHGTAATVNGGVLIQIPEITTGQDFCDFYGLPFEDGAVTLFKLVSEGFVSDHRTSYRPGEKPEAADWNERPVCGGGLHFSPRPFMARKYATGSRFVACRVELDGLVVINDYGLPDKAKARSCEVLYECDEDGERVGEKVPA